MCVQQHLAKQHQLTMTTTKEVHLRVLQDVWRDKETLQRHLRDHSIDDPNEAGETLLHVACASARFGGHSSFLVKQLLQAGADPNMATASKRAHSSDDGTISCSSNPPA